MRKRRTTWMILLAILATAGAGSYWYFTSQAQAAEVAEPEVQTTTVRRGGITVAATGAGSVIPAEEISLSFGTAGVLSEILVAVGDRVSAGDVLAWVDDADAQEALTSARLQLEQTRMQTDGTATSVGLSYDDISVAQAQLNLDSARSALDDLLNWTADPDEIARLEASLAAAQASYDASRGQNAADGNSIAVSAIGVEQAERDLTDAQAAYDTAYDPARAWELGDARRGPQLEAERERADAALLRAQESLRVAQLNYGSTVARTSNSSMLSAQVSLLSAQQSLTDSQAGPGNDELAAAERAVRQAELTLQQAQLNRESHVLSLEAAQISVAQAEEAVAGTVLTAPIAGTVMAINGGVGESAPSGFIVLADLAQPMLEIFLDEADLNMIGHNYRVDVNFDALPEQTFSGHVVQIDPELTVSGGVSVVRALVQLDDSSFAKPQSLPVGMNATVDVISGQTTNALLVPVEALREISAGSYAVFIVVDGELELRPVNVGLMDFTFAEILSGLEQGDLVTTGIVETQ